MSESPSELLKEIPWSKEQGSIWPVTALTLRRNLSHFRFPSRCDKAEETQIIQKLSKHLGELPQFVQKDLPAEQKQFLYEHFLFLRKLDSPVIALDPKQEMLAAINADNHLELTKLQIRMPLEEGWQVLSKMETAIGQSLGFAFSPKFGYLTSNPATAGTGLTISAYLHVPALIRLGMLEDHLPLPGEDEVMALGLSGNLEELTGDIVILQNNFTIGLTEESILSSIQKLAQKISGAERTAREKIKTDQTPEIKDLISKAYGLLKHSYQLEVGEALDLISLIKLGLALDWVSGVSDQTLNELLFKTRRGHLSLEVPEEKEVAHKRAEFLHKKLDGMQLSSILE